MLTRSITFSAFFLGADLLIYFLLYLILAMFLSNFPFLVALKDGMDWVGFRFFYLQAFIQLALLVVVRYYSLQSVFPLVLGLCVLAFILPILFFIRDASGLAGYFAINLAGRYVGPGLVIVFSSSLAWLLIRLLDRGPSTIP